MPAGNRYDVLWIMADQLRFHALSSSGDPNVVTPNIDRLVAEGVRCSAACSQYPVCVPFRAGLVTGRYASANGTTRHGDFLDPRARTVAHAFREAGFRTSWVGKWHLAPEAGAHMVTPDGWIGQGFWVHPAFRGGFEDWFGFNVANNYYETYIATGEKIEPQRLEGYQTEALTDLSIEYLSQRPPDEPWFHVVSYESPHPGWGGTPSSRLYPVPDRYEAMFEPRDLALRENVPRDAEAAARSQLAGYYRLVSSLDDSVGRLLDWLDASGRSESTLVVFFSDHGEMGGSHGLRNKEVPFEESLHIPLVWRLPGTLPAGVDYGHPICGLDIFPTTASLAGVRPPPGLDGLDYAQALARMAGPLRDAVLVQWDEPRFAFGDHPYRALRTERYTYCVGRDDGFCLLFDHAVDPFELDNLYASEAAAELRASLHARLLSLLDEAGEPYPEYVIRRSPPRPRA